MSWRRATPLGASLCLHVLFILPGAGFRALGPGKVKPVGQSLPPQQHLNWATWWQEQSRCLLGFPPAWEAVLGPRHSWLGPRQLRAAAPAARTTALLQAVLRAQLEGCGCAELGRIQAKRS